MPYLSQVGRDRRSLRQPLKVYGPNILRDMVGAFFAEVTKAQNGNGSYTGKARPDIPSFVRQIPNLIRDYTFQETSQ